MMQARAKRPTFTGLVDLVAPGFAAVTGFALTLDAASGEFSASSVYISFGALLFCIGFTYLVHRFALVVTAPMWDEYERQQAQATPADTATRADEEAKGLALRWYVGIGAIYALLGATITTVFLGNVLFGFGIGLLLAGYLVAAKVILSVLFQGLFKRPRLRW